MPFISILAIRPHDNADSLEIRVIRKWIPYRKQELCYLFVDTHGDAIEEIADLNNQSHFESLITLDSCYNVSDYLSDTTRSYMNVVPQTACIRLGLRTSFLQIDDNTTIPHYYYNFVNYDRLRPHISNHLLLTNYIGRMEKASPILNKAQNNLLKITLQDQSGNFIEATLWEQIAFSFNREAALRKPQPVIIAMISLKVTEYKGRHKYRPFIYHYNCILISYIITGTIQLGSTNATTIDINPDIEDLENINTRYYHSLT
ncbi:putative replication protein A, OB [Helianthus anomalus]